MEDAERESKFLADATMNRMIESDFESRLRSRPQ